MPSISKSIIVVLGAWALTITLAPVNAQTLTGSNITRPGFTPTPSPTPNGSPTPVITTTKTAPQTDSEKKAGNSKLSSLKDSRSLPPLPSMERTGVASEGTLPLSLNEAIRLALANNNDIEIAKDDVRFAEATLRALGGVYDPLFSFAPQISHRVTPSASALSGANLSGTLTTNDYDFNQSVTKLFTKGGGQYQIFFNNARETSNSTNAQLSPFYASSLGIQFTQPLLRNRSIDFNRRSIRVQRKILAQSDADFRRFATNVIYSVQHAYWELAYALHDEQNRLANLNQARDLFRQTEERISAGAVAPLSRAEVATELSNREAELLASSQSVTIAENNLKELILRDPQKPEWFVRLIPIEQPTFDEGPMVLKDSLAEARTSRPDLYRLRLQKEIADIDVQYFKNQTRARIDIQATIASTGLAGSLNIPSESLKSSAFLSATALGQIPQNVSDLQESPAAVLLDQINKGRITQQFASISAPMATSQTLQVPDHFIGGYGQALQNLFSFNTRTIVVGLTIEIPYHNTKARAELAGARILREQLDSRIHAREQAIEVEVRDATQTVETARRRIMAARALRQNAELQLEGEQRLYEFAHSTTFLLFQRENQLAAARTLELRAETDWNNAVADLQRATSTTLQVNNVTVIAKGP
ncbi:MAG: hypothetical protein DMF72_18335 [Acidobacteria bacterium]|nr:MAG: hypothetical protein DMF72_18335 [Acidobacteriota bacterium]